MAEEDVELEETGSDPDQAAGAKSGSKKFLVLGIVGVLVLGGGGFALYRSMTVKPEVQASEAQDGEGESESEAGEDEESLLATGAIVSLDPLLVNLADEEKKRFIRVKIELVFDDAEEMDEVASSAFAIAKARHVALGLIGTKRSHEIGDPKGQAALRKELLAELRKNLSGADVVEILFTEFIIQY